MTLSGWTHGHALLAGRRLDNTHPQTSGRHAAGHVSMEQTAVEAAALATDLDGSADAVIALAQSG
jgi:hypothetical protein